jgi:hypothetical protein
MQGYAVHKLIQQGMKRVGPEGEGEVKENTKNKQIKLKKKRLDKKKMGWWNTYVCVRHGRGYYNIKSRRTS